MKTISHFNLPENTNTLYENEAISSISLTRDITDKMNEIVDLINQFSTDDLEWKQQQEGAIRKGVIYMRDNLMNSLDDLITSLKNAGFFEARLEEYVADLKIRLDNAIKGVTVDTEIIDGRVAEDGLVYATIGNAIRGQMEKKMGVWSSLPAETDLDKFTKPGYFFIQYTSNYHHLPDGVSKTGGMLINVYENEYRHYQVVMSYNGYDMFIRNSVGTTFTPWKALTKPEQQEFDMKPNTSTDLNEYVNSGFYHLTTLSQGTYTNLPNNENAGMLCVYGGYENSGYLGRLYQLFIGINQTIHFRNRDYLGNWSNWKTITANTSPYKVKKISDTEFHIYRVCSGGMIRYKYFKNVNTAINLDTWQLGEIYQCDMIGTPLKRISADGYDNEGVVQIVGEADFIGGIHGDEKFTDVCIFINGKRYTPENIPDVNADEIRIIVKSNLTHADTTNVCMTRTKQTTFDNGGVHINNKWKLLEDVEISKVYGSLFSIDKTVVNKYYDSKVHTFPEDIPAKNGSWLNDEMIDTYYMGDVSARVWTGERGGEQSMWRTEVYDYEIRMKSYFGCYYGYSAKSGEELHANGNFNITC